MGLTKKPWRSCARGEKLELFISKCKFAYKVKSGYVIRICPRSR